MMTWLNQGFCLFFGLAGSLAWAHADIRPDKIHTADAKKNGYYVQDGMIIGGDQAIDEVVVKDIRRAPNPGFERIVIDLEGNKKGESAGVDRPPYYQVAVTPDEKRVMFTVWGRPKLTFDPKKIIRAFQKSPVVENVSLLPRLEEDRWSFVMDLKPGFPVEVFELSNPVRIILDIRTKKSKI